MLPAGLVPLGLFTEFPARRDAGPVAILADYVDPVSGDIIDLLATRTPVDGALIEGLRVERDSGPAVALVGQTLRQIRHLDETATAEGASRARDGYRELERLGLVRTQGVQVEAVDDELQIYVTIIDLTLASGQPNKRTYAAPRAGSAKG